MTGTTKGGRCCSGSSRKGKPGRANRYRLPENVVPSHYELEISPDLVSKSFTGRVTIDVDVVEATCVVELNSKSLDVQSARAISADGTTVGATIRLNDETEIASLHFPCPLYPARWQLQLEFRGQNSHNSQGFFASTYKDAQENEHTILCTQFESADARAAFPCFDEPAMKATFKVKMLVAEALTALSNGDIIKVTPQPNGKKLVEFEPTLKMSTYLVCFVVGELAQGASAVVNGKRLTMWTVPEKAGETQEALNVASFGLDYLEHYFDIPYRFGDKIDFVAVPGFAWGGMENVGLVILQEGAVIEPGDWGAVIILHEIAHQWFGDLVTMRWWNGLWLNESFATFMSYKAGDAYRPEAKYWENFGHSRQSAFKMDCLRHTHPIEQTVERGSDAIYLVDPISYEKGCSVLYQMEQFIGEEAFRKGISSYLKKHEFGNTEACDLWQSLEETCRQEGVTAPLSAVLATWVNQPGHPLVSVRRLGGKSGKFGKIQLSQRIFLTAQKGRRSTKVWPIPIAMEVKDKDGKLSLTRLMLDGRHLTLDVGEGFQWVKLDAGATGFYRVRYSSELLQRLVDDEQAALNTPERYKLLLDARALFDASLMSPAEYLPLIIKMQAFEHLDTLSRIASQKQSWRRRLRSHLASELQNIAVTSNWQGDTLLPFAAKWNPYLLNMNRSVQRLSRKVMENWSQDPESVLPEHAAVASMVLRYAGKTLPPAFKALYQEPAMPEPRALQDYLVYLAQLHEVDAFQLFARIMLNQHNNKQRVNKFIAEWPEMIKGAAPMELMYAVRYRLENVDSAEQEAQLIELFKQHPNREARMECARALERVRGNIESNRQQGARLSQYLSQSASSRRAA